MDSKLETEEEGHHSPVVNSPTNLYIGEKAPATIAIADQRNDDTNGTEMHGWRLYMVQLRYSTIRSQ